MYPYNDLKLKPIPQKLPHNTEELIKSISYKSWPNTDTEAFLKAYTVPWYLDQV